MPETAILYSDSGAGKTTALGALAKWVYEEYGLFTRLVSSDDWSPLSNAGLIHHPRDNPEGIIHAFDISARTTLLADLRKLSRGYWPKIVRESVQVPDDLGNMVSKPANVRRIVEDKAELAKVGLYCLETADGISDLFMNYIVNKEIVEENDRGQLKVKAIGPQGASGRYEEDGEVLGGNSEGHFGVVQKEMHSLFTAFSGLASNVKMVIWTAHVGMGKLGNQKSTDSSGRKRLSGESCFCPLLVGEAKNALVPSWVGDCFHLADVPLIMNEEGEVIQQKQVKAFYENHREDGIMEGPQYRCKSRVAIEDIEELHKQFPGGFISLGIGEGEGLDQYYRWLKGRKDKNMNVMKKWKEEIDAKRKAVA